MRPLVIGVVTSIGFVATGVGDCVLDVLEPVLAAGAAGAAFGEERGRDGELEALLAVVVVVLEPGTAILEP